MHSDEVVNQIKGGNSPIMNLHERVLSVLACRYTDEVVIGAPWAVTQQLLTSMRVNVVAHGTTSDYAIGSTSAAALPDAYALPRQSGLYKEFKSVHPELTTTRLLERILHNRQLYIERNRRKEAKEVAAGNVSAAAAPAAAAASTAAATTSSASKSK